LRAGFALDDSDDDNGCMVVVPGSNHYGILRVEKADIATSFTNGQTEMPADCKELSLQMQAGDVLFFGGLTIHGSYPNKTTDRFRRSFIVHFDAIHQERVSQDEATHMTSLGKT